MNENIKKGKLKIYMGMSPGVGKTYAMLKDAIHESSQGKDIVIGYVEPHGRIETEELCGSLEKIQVLSVEYKGLTLQEFDLAKALERQPSILLVDELAHTNAPGLAHAKRWQDVQTLLDSGISVYTTLNIQHVESVSEVVSSIIDSEVSETIPDTIIKNADSIEIVDIPPEELIHRLKSGKIYRKENVPDALANFFRIENLIALRELLLRKAAEKVDSDFIKHRSEIVSREDWVSSNRVVVAVGANKFARKLIRRAGLIAASRKSKLTVLQIQKPNNEVLTEISQMYLDRALATAMAIGADIEKRYASDIAGEIIEFTKSINASLIVVGKPIKNWLSDFTKKSIADELIRRSGNIDVILIRSDSEKEVVSVGRVSKPKIDFFTILKSINLLIVVVLASMLIEPFVELVTVSMIFMLSTVLLARIAGIYELAIYSFLLISAFNFFFIEPKFTFDVYDTEYFVSFLAMFLVSFSMSRLIQQVRSQQVIVNERERKALILYKMSKELISAHDTRDIVEVVLSTITSILSCDAVMYLRNKNGEFDAYPDKSFPISESKEEQAVMNFSFDRNEQVGFLTNTFPGAHGHYLPISIKNKVFGVCCLLLRDKVGVGFDKSLLMDIELVNQQLALCLEKRMLQEETFEVTLANSLHEKKNLVLGSVSHDFKTPLTIIEGASEQILLHEKNSGLVREFAELISTQSSKLYKIVNNALYYYQLEDPEFKLNLEWESLEEIVANVVSRYKNQLSRRVVKIECSEEIPLVRVDGVLFDQLLSNIIENSILHSPQSTILKITVDYADNGNFFTITVIDDGLSLSTDKITDIEMSDMKKSRTTGLGFKICSLIMQMHGGSFHFERYQSSGSCAKIVFPANEIKKIQQILNEN